MKWTGSMCLVLCGVVWSSTASRAADQGATPTVAPAPTAPTINLSAKIGELTVTKGSLSGAFRNMRGSDRVNWHAANLGLIPLVTLENDEMIRAYLNQYLNHVNAKTGLIQDYDAVKSKPLPIASDDVDASSFLSLAVQYQQIINNQAWWQSNLPAMKNIAQQVLVMAQKDSGLVRARLADGPTGQAFLMNNCEDYRGLKDFANQLQEENDPDAAKFAATAGLIAKGISALFNENSKAFRISDKPWGSTFFPDRLGQVYPELFEVPLGTDTETQRKYDAAWRYLNGKGDTWEKGTLIDATDKSMGGLPWLLLGITATKRGDTARANAHLTYFLTQLSLPKVPAPFTSIQELGFALQIQNSPVQVQQR